MQILSLFPINVNLDKASMIEIPKPHAHMYTIFNKTLTAVDLKQVLYKKTPNLWQRPKESKLHPPATTAPLYPPF